MKIQSAARLEVLACSIKACSKHGLIYTAINHLSLITMLPIMRHANKLHEVAMAQKE